jgi:hypothetical protein
MARQNLGIRLCGRKQTAARQSWDCIEWIDGQLADITPERGHYYTRYTWPPRGRGRGESMWSPRRIAAKLRAIEVFRLRCAGLTWQAIASATGFKDASGAYRAYRRVLDRLLWEEARYGR